MANEQTGKSTVRELMDENAALAAWQCIHTDGKTGLTHDDWANASCAKDTAIATLTADNERLSARVARLEAALKPFAKEAEAWGGYDDAEHLVEEWQGGPSTMINVGHLRYALRELEEGK